MGRLARAFASAIALIHDKRASSVQVGFVSVGTSCEERFDDSSTTRVENAIVFWHGMGDVGDASGTLAVMDAAVKTLGSETTCARSLRFGASARADRMSGYTGDVDAQVGAACDAMRADDAIGRARSVHVVGFSQGGQFMRALVQRCGRELGVRTLVTLGGQHMGVDAVPGCGDPERASMACQAMNDAASYASASAWARRTVVQAQYFRDTSTHARYNRYLATNEFLPRINNEGQANENARNREALTSLERFVMFMFEEDDMVSPKESSWFGSRVVAGANRTKIIPYYENESIYAALGLDALDRDNRIEMRLIPGAQHMQFTVDWFVSEIVKKYWL
ncbi:Palmitoyl protein thioesterase [Ostreococcus tauri]|uniref:Palmitoyl-protein thioesterase 1 n=1 Tax=Ostreococcus tauri TaxID=70448 RepID=A0A096P917_OSTTA|nr:Palmitoyl protein thioesterase [Ostreococcus tauri]CEG00531.1 Palmitoyl protein thioesterase [Ostreococcus tauri]|eukprot:XP_022840429.1 Palmitoyl protein thioesterase [Ostreococcus tauri]